MSLDLILLPEVKTNDSWQECPVPDEWWNPYLFNELLDILNLDHQALPEDLWEASKATLDIWKHQGVRIVCVDITLLTNFDYTKFYLDHTSIKEAYPLFGGQDDLPVIIEPCLGQSYHKDLEYYSSFGSPVRIVAIVE